MARKGSRRCIDDAGIHDRAPPYPKPVPGQIVIDPGEQAIPQFMALHEVVELADEGLVQGRLLRRENKKNGNIFYNCSNYPYCKHRQWPCLVCREGLLVRDQEKFKCHDCGQSTEACLGVVAGCRSKWASTDDSWDAQAI